MKKIRKKKKKKFCTSQLHFLLQKLMVTVKVKGKGKTIPIQAWTGPEGTKRLRLPDFKTVIT